MTPLATVQVYIPRSPVPGGTFYIGKGAPVHLRAVESEEVTPQRMARNR